MFNFVKFLFIGGIIIFVFLVGFKAVTQFREEGEIDLSGAVITVGEAAVETKQEVVNLLDEVLVVETGNTEDLTDHLDPGVEEISVNPIVLENHKLDFPNLFLEESAKSSVPDSSMSGEFLLRVVEILMATSRELEVRGYEKSE